MRICIDAYHAVGGYGGIHNYTVNLIKELLKIDSKNQYLLFYNSFRINNKTLPDFESKNVTNIVCRLPRRLLTRMWDITRFPPIEFLTGKIDIYHSLHFVLPAHYKGKSILTIHDVTYLKHPECFSPDPQNEYGYRISLPNAARRADRIIAISNSTKRDVVKFLGIPEEKIEVIYFGAGDEYRPALRRADILKNIGIGKGEFILYAMGTIEPRKNIKNLLESYRLFIERCRRDVSLVLAGVGRFPDDVRKKIEQDNLSSKVILKEGIPEEYMPVLMNGASLFIYPSLYEGFGLPVLEAMACGKAVITSNVSSMPEVAGDAGVLIDPQDIEGMSAALEKVLLDDEFRNDLGKRALNRSKLFSWEKCARETLKVYGG